MAGGDEEYGEFLAKYEIENEESDVVLGRGACSVVFKARCTTTGRLVAVKKMRMEDWEEEGVPSAALREISLLKELSHPNVVELLDVCFHLSYVHKLWLAFEFAGTNLKKYMKSCGHHLEPHVIKSLGFQLCRGIGFCHANRVLHRNLKPQSLLIDSQLRLKIADFGLARVYTPPMACAVQSGVSVWYSPLEILLGSPFYSVPVDMWGVGCMLAEMASGSPLFRGDSEIDTVFKIFQKLGTPNAERWPGVADLPDFKYTWPKWKPRGWDNIRNTKAQIGADGIDLLESLMVYEPSKRLSACRALQHRYFDDVTVPEALL